MTKYASGAETVKTIVTTSRIDIASVSSLSV